MSAIPRLSKLPLPRPTSAIPKPPSVLPRPTSTIRHSASRDSLGAGSNLGGELRNPRLRPSLSRDQLRTSVNGSGDLRNTKLRPAVSREQLNSGTRRTSLISKPPALPPATRPSLSRPPSTPRRQSEAQTYTIEEQSTTPPYDPPGEAISVEPDGHIFHRRLTLTRRPSEVFITSPLEELGDPVPLFQHGEQQRPSTASTEGGEPYDTIRTRSRKPRPSLSERTIETLAQIPSSPAVRRRPSAFFEQGRPSSGAEGRPGSRADSRPRSRADSGASRPGSSYNSDGSVRLSSRPGSRPGSSSGQPDLGFSNFRASTNAYKPPLTTIDDSPQKRTSSIPPVRTPKSRMQTPRAGLASTPKLSPARPPLSNLRSPSPAKTMLPPKSGSKTMTARPTKPRANVKGLFKKPSLPALNKPALHGASSRNTSGNSSTTSWDGTIPSSASTTASNNTALSPDLVEPATPPSVQKSSSALREQIAKAKAAKRAQLRQASEAQPQLDQEAPIVPSDNGFDFGMNNDPFNLRRGEDPKKRVLQTRASAARTTGRLNIAALHLKDIPVEVLKMYDLESIDTGSWAESVDLTRFVAADNELEELDNFIFPDTSPDMFNEEQASRGNIFGGLETLDLHGNLLVGVPLGIRRLTCLTSLNLVRDS